MKTIIAGSRGIVNYTDLLIAMKNVEWDITEVVSGCAKGVDKLGEMWAENNKVNITRFPAQWKLHGKAAGHARNEQMASYADALLAVWDGESKGTKNMIHLAQISHLRISIHIVK